MLERADPGLFDWLSWRRGSPADFGVRGRELIRAAPSLRSAAVAWADGASLPCRPKCGTVAVMFDLGAEPFWFHLTRAEFDEVFCGKDGGR